MEFVHIKRDTYVIKLHHGSQIAFDLLYSTSGVDLNLKISLSVLFSESSLFLPRSIFSTLPMLQEIETPSFITKFYFVYLINQNYWVSPMPDNGLDTFTFLNLSWYYFETHIVISRPGSGRQGEEPEQVQRHLSITSTQAHRLFHVASDPVR